MKSITELLDITTLSKTEQDIIVDVFNNPTVIKYLKIMGRNDLEELLLLSVTERDDKEVSKKHALIQGKLSVISTLLSLQKS